MPQQTTFNALAKVPISDFQVNQINFNALVKNVNSVVTFLDGVAAIEVVLRNLGNVTLCVQTVKLLALLLRAVTHEPSTLAEDAPGYGVVGKAPAFPVLTKVVLSRFRRPRLPLEPDVSVRKCLPSQEVRSLLGDFCSLRKMLSQHLILVTRPVNCSFGLECLAQILL